MREEKLRVSLLNKTDRLGKKFYVGNIKFPGNLDCSKGVSFMIFVSEEGAEELQISENHFDNEDRGRNRAPRGRYNDQQDQNDQNDVDYNSSGARDYNSR